MVFDKFFWFFCAVVGFAGGVTLIWAGLTVDYPMTRLPFGLSAAALFLGSLGCVVVGFERLQTDKAEAALVEG